MAVIMEISKQTYKNVKTFEEFEQQTYYHGSTANFNSLRNSHIFVTHSIKFAKEYASAKSFEGGLDADLYIYTLKPKHQLNIFNVNNETDTKFFLKNAPNDIKIHGDKISKEDWLFQAKGKKLNKGLEISGLKFGDTFEYDISGNKNIKQFYFVRKNNNEVIAVSHDFEYEVISPRGKAENGDIQKLREEYEKFVYNQKYINKLPIDTYYENLRILCKKLLEKYIRIKEEIGDVIRIKTFDYIDDGYNTYHAFEASHILLMWFEKYYDGVLMKEKGKDTYMIFDAAKSFEIIGKQKI